MVPRPGCVWATATACVWCASEPGTTVVHEGFVNFNAGTLGTSMVEGRISKALWWATVPMWAAVLLRWGRSLAAARSASRLVNVPAGCGVGYRHRARRRLCGGSRSVRDRRVARSVLIPGENRSRPPSFWGSQTFLFRRNSVSGAIEVLPRAKNTVELNDACT